MEIIYKFLTNFNLLHLAGNSTRLKIHTFIVIKYVNARYICLFFIIVSLLMAKNHDIDTQQTKVPKFVYRYF